jgi:uncharacterized membrane protein HdeD (DUF308 family)
MRFQRASDSRRPSIGAIAVVVGAAMVAYGALQPWAAVPMDYGRDAITCLVAGAVLMLVGLVMMARPSSRSLSVVALVLASVIVAIVLRDTLEIAQRASSPIQVGLYATGLGALIAAAGAVVAGRGSFRRSAG